MPTIIHFVGRDQLMVRESGDEVQAAFDESEGRAIALTHQRTGKAVFVNPGQVTYWRSRGGVRQERSRPTMGRMPSLR